MRIYLAFALVLCLSACAQGETHGSTAADAAQSATEAEAAADAAQAASGRTRSGEAMAQQAPYGMGSMSEAAAAANAAAEAADTASTAADASVEPQSFGGYDCIQDCSGHQAGYDWAEQNEITDSDDCGGNSQSFIEGCEAYADEHQDADSDDADADSE